MTWEFLFVGAVGFAIAHQIWSAHLAELARLDRIEVQLEHISADIHRLSVSVERVEFALSPPKPLTAA
ncbi:MAG: hypothetical protein J2P50_11740 [Hyphomicrobiaceae bacterium]|nr:hypothetical protein [Hyphomicrobiaceae bacterium]